MKRTTVTKKLGTRTKYELPTFEAPPVKLTQAELESVVARLIVEDPDAAIVACRDCPWVGRPPGPRMAKSGAIAIPVALCPECDCTVLDTVKFPGAYRA